jgi:hypothetical protein
LALRDAPHESAARVTDTKEITESKNSSTRTVFEIKALHPSIVISSFFIIVILRQKGKLRQVFSKNNFSKPRIFPSFRNRHKKRTPESVPLLFLLSVCAERKQCDGACSLDGQIDFALMFRAGSRNTTRKNFAAFGNEMAKCRHVLVINGIDFIDAALADLSSRSSDSVSLNHACVLRISDQNGISSSVFGAPN